MDQEIKQPAKTQPTSIYSDNGFKYVKLDYPYIQKKTYQLLLRIFSQLARDNVLDWFETYKWKADSRAKPVYSDNPSRFTRDLLALVPKPFKIKESEILAIVKASQDSANQNVAQTRTNKAVKEEKAKMDGKVSVQKGKVSKVKTSQLKEKKEQEYESSEEDDLDEDEGDVSSEEEDSDEDDEKSEEDSDNE